MDIKKLLILYGLLAASPVFGQSSLLVARARYYVDEAGIPYNGDSTTLAYNSQLLINQSRSWRMDPEGNLKLRSRTTDYSYDANGKLLYFAYQLGDDVNGWTDKFRYTYTFDPNGNQLSYLSEEWNGNAWVTMSDSRVRVFDANGNLISSTGTTQRTLLTYDAEDLLQTETLQFLVNGNWVNHSRKVYTYLPNFTTLRITAHWMGTGWSDTYRSTINYNASGKVVQHSSESWDGTIWTNDSRILNSYNANGDLLEETIQFWKGTDWENFHLISNSYDAANNHIYWISTDWIDSTWVGYVRQFLSYDIENRFINSRTESGTSGDWRLSTYGNFYYDDFVSTQTLSPTDFEVFPNPASSWISLKGEGILYVNILDQQGRPVHAQRLHGRGDETIQVGHLPTGNYLLQVIGVDGKLGVKLLQIMR